MTAAARLRGLGALWFAALWRVAAIVCAGLLVALLIAWVLGIR